MIQFAVPTFKVCVPREIRLIDPFDSSRGKGKGFKMKVWRRIKRGNSMGAERTEWTSLSTAIDAILDTVSSALSDNEIFSDYPEYGG